MKAYKLLCANNTENHPSTLGYTNGQLKKLPLNAQVVDRRAVCIIPDYARDPLVSIGWVALNTGTISDPVWKMCSMPLKAHLQDLYVETHHIDNLSVANLSQKLKAAARFCDAISNFNKV